MTRHILRLELMWRPRSALTGTLLASSALCVGLSLWMGVSQPSISLAAESVNADSTRAVAYAVQLRRSLQAIEDGRQQAPRDRWDPQFIVDTVGISPAALYGYVRSNVGWVPYRGQLRGPVGTLMDRRANSLDMSLLLARLLTLAGHNVRLAHAELSEDAVDKLWQNLSDLTANPPGSAVSDNSGVAPPVEATPLEAPAAPAITEQPESEGSPATGTPTNDGAGSGSVFGDAGAASGSLFESAPAPEAAPQSAEDAASLYEIDSSVASKALNAFADMHESLADKLQTRVDSQSSRLLSYFNPSTPAQLAAEENAARAALADHWWVEVQSNGAWTDYDLLSSDGTPGTAIAAPSMTFMPNDLPPEFKQRVQFKVVAEQLLDGKLRENTVLTTEFDPSQVIGKRIVVNSLPLLWPSDWNAITPDDVQEKLFAALYTQKEWMPSLTIGEEAIQRSSVLDTGAINPEPQPQSNPFLSIAFPVAGKVGRITDMFGQMLDENAGLGGADEAPSLDSGSKAAGELTAEWLEYTILVPGKEPIVTRRELFDLLGPALRRKGDYSSFRLTEAKRLERAAGEMTSTEIVILPCWPASEFLADLAAGLALANKPLLDEFTRDPFGKTPPNSVELFSKMAGMPASAYLYSMLRSEVSRIASSAFVDRPQIVTQHGVLTRVTAGELTSSAAIDIVENGIGVDPFSDRDPFLVRLLQGIADTNAEALALPGAGDSVADLYDKSGADSEWTMLSPADKGAIAKLDLSPDYSARLMADLDAGQLVFSYGGTLEKGEPIGWWRIDPVTGQTLGMGARGWGQDLVEFAFHLTIQAMLAHVSCMAFTAAAEEKISSLSAEQGREKIKTWARNCVSQALLETISGLSISWIQSSFIDGARVPTWNQRAKQGTHITTSNNTSVHLPPTNPPHVNPPESNTTTRQNTHNDPHTTPPHDEAASTRTRTPPQDEAHNQPRTNPPEDNVASNTNRPPKTENEDNTPNTRKPPTTEDNTSNTRKPPTTEDDTSTTRKPPTTDDNTANTRKPPTTDDNTFDKKPWPTDDKSNTPKRPAPGEDGDTAKSGTQSASNQRPGQGEDGGPAKSGDQSDLSKTQPLPGSPADKIQQQTQDAMDARKAQVEAAKKYYDDPTAENKQAYQEAEGRSRDASTREENAWAQNGGKGVPPGTRNQEPMPTPPKDWTPGKVIGGEEPGAGSPAPNPAPSAQAETGPPAPSKPVLPEAEGPPSPPAKTGSNTGPIPHEAEGPSPTTTQPMPNAPQRPAQGEDIGTAKTQGQPASPPQSPSIDDMLEQIRPQREARAAAQRAEIEAEDALAQNKNPANKEMLEKKLDDANNAYNKAHMAELNAWANAGGRGFPPKEVISAPIPAEPVQHAEQEGPPSPPARTGPNAEPLPREAQGPSPTTTQSMPNAPQRPASGEDIGMAKGANQSASNQTQSMPNAPQRPASGEDIGTAKTQSASPPPSPKPGGQPEVADKNVMDARKAEIDAHNRYYQDATPENLKAYQEAVQKSRDLVAGKITQQTQDAMNAHKAEVDALKKYYGNPTAENKAAYQEAAGRSRDATNQEEQAWWRNGGNGVPPGTENRGPMPAAPKDWTPGKVIDGELSQEKSPVGPNATMAMGLGALTSTIQTGP